MKERPTFPARLDFSGAKPALKRPEASAVRPAFNAIPASSVRIQTAISALDSSSVRARMVTRLMEQGLSDAAVMSAMRVVERHRFVDSALGNQAYEDTSLPIGLGQTIS